MAGQIIFPINEISSYTPKWMIKARVTNKAPVRTFKKGAGEGKVFHVDLLDAMGGEIRATFFNECADAYVNVLQVGKCFVLSRGNVKIANRQYNSCNHKYELTFDNTNVLITEAGDDSSIEAQKFTITSLRSVLLKQLPARVDLCGVVTSFLPVMEVNAKDGSRQFVKRDITIADDTSTSMSVTLWGDTAKTEDSKLEGSPVIALKSVSVKEWNGGRSGSLLDSGTLQFKPTGTEAARIEAWWKEGGSTQSLQALSVSGSTGGGARARNARSCSLVEMRHAADNLVSDQPEHYSVVARLSLVQLTKQGEKQPLYYSACAEPKTGSTLLCNRRVDERGFCASCNLSGKTAIRLNMRCRFTDCEDGAWLTTFHEASEKVLGKSGDQLRDLETGEGGRDAAEGYIRSLYFGQPFQLVVRAKLDSYQGEMRSNVTCVDVLPLNLREHGREMLKAIQQMCEK